MIPGCSPIWLTETLAAYGARQAARLGATLRAVHVWTESSAMVSRRRLDRHDRITDADRLLADVLDEHLPGARYERQVLHDRDPARALAELSRTGSLLIVGARSRAPARDDVLGTTTAALLGRTACPLAVLPHPLHG